MRKPMVLACVVMLFSACDLWDDDDPTRCTETSLTMLQTRGQWEGCENLVCTEPGTPGRCSCTCEDVPDMDDEDEDDERD